MIDHRAFAALAFTVLVWGISPVFIRTLSVELGAAHSLVLRYVIAATIFIVFLSSTVGWRIARADWPRLLIVSMLGMFGYNIGSVYGFELVQAGVGSLLISTQPLLIAILAAIFLRERLSTAIVAGLAIALAGSVLLLSGHLASDAGATQPLRGSLYIFLSGLCWSFYVVLGKPLIMQYGAFKISGLSIIIATVPMLFLASVDTWAMVPTLTAKQWSELLYMAAVSSFVTTLTWNFAVGRLPARLFGSCLYLMPLITVVAGALILGETITLATILGGALILAGVAVAQAAPLWRRVLLWRS
ncbi:DMT family transporter [soil metagenome]